MTLDELRLRLQQICEEGARETNEPYRPMERRRAFAQLQELFAEHRGEVFEISKEVDEHGWRKYPESYYVKWSQFEKEIRQNMPDMHSLLQRNAIAFFTCSCGSREDSCSEDGVGNFSTFIFMPDGEVFRRVEKKQ